MVENTNVEQFGSLFDFACQTVIFGAWRKSSRRMVVDKDHAGRKMVDGLAHDYFRIYDSGGCSSAAYEAVGYHGV